MGAKSVLQLALSPTKFRLKQPVGADNSPAPGATFPKQRQTEGVALAAWHKIGRGYGAAVFDV
jgi:hypothetical protein